MDSATRLDTLDLSIRAFHVLHNAGIQTVGDLAEFSETELLRLENFGRKSLNEVKRILPGVIRKLPAPGGSISKRRSEHRIEALRAASRIVAAQEGAGKSFVHGPMYEATRIAEQFAQWLETGECLSI